jgi:hypothetical protein
MNVARGTAARFKNLSIGRKLACAFIVLVVGLVVVVLVGSNGMSSMTAAHNEVVTVGVPKQLAAETARGGASDMHFSQTQYVLDRGAARQNHLDAASTEQVSASTEETSASAQQIAASAQQLADNAEGLNRLVARFKLSA